MSDFGRLQEIARAAGVQVNAPVNTIPPQVSPETVAVGAALNCTTGDWDNQPDSYTYQWMRSAAPVSTGTAADYTTVAEDAGHSLSCTVTATNTVGPASSSSNAAAVTATAAASAAAPATPASTPSSAPATPASSSTSSSDTRRK